VLIVKQDEPAWNAAAPSGGEASPKKKGKQGK
jgi:hypothetical protein